MLYLFCCFVSPPHFLNLFTIIEIMYTFLQLYDLYVDENFISIASVADACITYLLMFLV